MQISLGHFFFSVLLSTGAALECKTCEGVNATTCTQTLKTCDATENNCITVLTKNNLEGTSPVNVVQMKCATKEMCQVPLIQLSFVDGHYVTKNATCCQKNYCTPPTPTIPTMSTILNGASCPTCYSETSECTKNETLNCTGLDTFCFSFYTTSDKTTNEGEIRGCTTEAACTALKTYDGPVVDKSFVKDVTCRKAKGSCSALECHFLSLLLMTLFLLSLH